MSTRSRAFVPWLAGVALATLAVGCDGCTKAGQLRVDGDFPYVRCLAVDEREAAEWSVGDLRLRSEGRVLTIEGIEPPLRMAAFVGPGPGSADPTRALGALGPHGAKLVWVLGELGDSEAHAQRTLAALAAYPGVSLVLASGRDDFDVLEEAWDSLSDEAAAHVIDLRPFRAVRVGTSVFGLTSGGAGGRYARNRSSCGFGEDDLEEVEDALPDAEEARRFMVSWAATAGGVARDEGGTDGGDPALAEFMTDNGIAGGLFAWPPHGAWSGSRVGTDRVTPLEERAADPAAQVVVGRIAGPPVERRDGSRAPNGALLLEVRDGGLAILGHAPSAP